MHDNLSEIGIQKLVVGWSLKVRSGIVDDDAVRDEITDMISYIPAVQAVMFDDDYAGARLVDTIVNTILIANNISVRTY